MNSETSTPPTKLVSKRRWEPWNLEVLLTGLRHYAITGIIISRMSWSDYGLLSSSSQLDAGIAYTRSIENGILDNGKSGWYLYLGEYSKPKQWVMQLAIFYLPRQEVYIFVDTPNPSRIAGKIVYCGSPDI